MWRRGKKKRHAEVEPDEILIDSQNISQFDTDRFEGRMERPIGSRSFAAADSLLCVLGLVLLARAGNLQLVAGEVYAKQARENQLAQSVIIADRGTIEDRTGRKL